MTRRTYFAIIIWALLCSACNNNDYKTKLTNELRLFMETEIAFPDNMFVKGYDEYIQDSTLLNRALKR